MIELRRLVLELLAVGADARWGQGGLYFYEAAKNKGGASISAQELMSVCWQLVGDGLIFVDFSQPAPDNWKWVLTERGRRAVQADKDYEPDDAVGYMGLLARRIDGLDEVVKTYATEAVHAYAAHCYLASSVMLGVASERAFLLLAEAFAETLDGTEAANFKSVLAGTKQKITTKFEEFRKRFEHRRNSLPESLGDNLPVILDGVASLLRIARNESGHPTQRYIDPKDAYVNLQMFGRYMERLEELRRYFVEAAASS